MPGGFGDAARGAATGASLGSFIPGVGTLIGGGLGALGGWLFGGGDDDEPKVNPEDATTAQLRGHAAKVGQIGDTLVDSGQGALDPVLNYLKGILGDDPQALLRATQGARGRVIDQYDTARQTIAQFGPRGGGTNAVLAGSRISQANALADVTSTARREAVGQAAALGTGLTGLGLTAAQIEQSDLNTIIQTILTREGFDVSKRGQNMEALGGLGEALGTIIAAKIGKPPA